jgi:hypothetical protein
LCYLRFPGYSLPPGIQPFFVMLEEPGIDKSTAMSDTAGVEKEIQQTVRLNLGCTPVRIVC